MKWMKRDEKKGIMDEKGIMRWMKSRVS